jgi:hypothetical protein
LNVASLQERVSSGEVEELILALSNDVEGEATCHYLTEHLAADANRPLKVTRIGFGLPSGVGGNRNGGDKTSDDREGQDAANRAATAGTNGRGALCTRCATLEFGRSTGHSMRAGLLLCLATSRPSPTVLARYLRFGCAFRRVDLFSQTLPPAPASANGCWLVATMFVVQPGRVDEPRGAFGPGVPSPGLSAVDFSRLPDGNGSVTSTV